MPSLPASRSGSRWNSISATAGTPTGAIPATPARPRGSRGPCPPGSRPDDIVWTAPHRFELPPLVNYGYAKHAMHLVQDHRRAGSRGRRTADACRARRAGWCARTCASRRAPICAASCRSAARGAGSIPRVAPLFAAARAQVPDAAPAPVGREQRGDSWCSCSAPDGARRLSANRDAGVLSLRRRRASNMRRRKRCTTLRGTRSQLSSMKVGDQPPHEGTGPRRADRRARAAAAGGRGAAVPRSRSPPALLAGGAPPAAAPRFAPARLRWRRHPR